MTTKKTGEKLREDCHHISLSPLYQGEERVCLYIVQGKFPKAFIIHDVGELMLWLSLANITRTDCVF